MDAQLPQRLEPNVQGRSELVFGPVKHDLVLIDPAAIQHALRVRQRLVEGGDGAVPIGSQIFQLALFQVEREGQIVVVVPARVAEASASRGDVLQRRFVRR